MESKEKENGETSKKATRALGEREEVEKRARLMRDVGATM